MAHAILSYQMVGSGTPPVVLLHPISMRAAFWRPVAEKLKTITSTILVDLRGHGDSPPTDKPFTLDDLAGDVTSLLESLQSAPYIVVGCSLGGMVAQGLAVNRPDLLAGVVLADTTHSRGEHGASIMRRRAQDTARGIQFTVDSDLERWLSPDFRMSHPEMVNQVRQWALNNSSATISQAWDAIAGLSYERALAQVSLPVLVTTGSLDVASPPASARATAAAFPNARYMEIPGAGHFSPIEQPELFSSIIKDFIRSL